MILESICPLTTNSSSEIYLFKNTSVEEVKSLLDAFNDSEMELSIKSVGSLQEALSHFYSDYSSYYWAASLIKEAFDCSYNKGFVFVREGNNRMAHWQHWDKKWCDKDELKYENQVEKFKNFLEEHYIAQQHLG